MGANLSVGTLNEPGWRLYLLPILRYYKILVLVAIREAVTIVRCSTILEIQLPALLCTPSKTPRGTFKSYFFPPLPVLLILLCVPSSELIYNLEYYWNERNLFFLVNSSHFATLVIEEVLSLLDVV